MSKLDELVESIATTELNKKVTVNIGGKRFKLKSVKLIEESTEVEHGSKSRD